MQIDEGKVDEAVLALLYLTSSEMNGVTRAWKGHDWDALNRLYEKGLISNPRSKAKSVLLTDEGAKKSKELFTKMFGMPG